MQNLLEGMKHFRAITQTLGEGGRADRKNHEFLNVDVVVRVRTTVDDVHHRNRQGLGTFSTEIAEERLLALSSRRVRSGKRYSEERIRSQA